MLDGRNSPVKMLEHQISKLCKFPLNWHEKCTFSKRGSKMSMVKKGSNVDFSVSTENLVKGAFRHPNKSIIKNMQKRSAMR